jgi:hypothetical protein
MRFVLPALLVVSVGTLAAAPVPKELKKRKNYFPTAVGTKWEYVSEDGGDSQTREVTAAVEKDGVRAITIVWTTGGSSQTWELREDAAGLSRAKMGAEAIDPPQQLIKGGLTEGQEWEGEYRQGGSTTRFRRVVGKAETVSTPAGEYTAVPVTQTDPDDPDDEATVWYAEGVGMVKLHEKGSSPLVLKAVTIGKQR